MFSKSELKWMLMHVKIIRQIMGRRCRLMSWMGSWLQPSEATVLHLALSSELCWFVYVWPRMRMQTQRHGNEEVSGLFTSRNRLNIIDFGEEINQRWSVALCPWQLNLTPFVLLCRYAPPSFSMADFQCPAYQSPFPNNKRVACRETSWIHTTSSLRSRPRRYQNHPQPRHCSRLIKL